MAAAHRTMESHYRQNNNIDGTTNGNNNQPSIFDILAQESLMSGLRPAARHLSKFLGWSYPNLFGAFARRFDEFYTIADILLQNYYLKNYSGTFSENFYEMKRVVRSAGGDDFYLPSSYRWLSLIATALIPYVRLKLDELHDRLKKCDNQQQRTPSSPAWMRMKRAFLAAYPWICAGLEAWTLALQAGYILSKTSVHSPWLLLAGVRLERMTPRDYDRINGQPNNGILPSNAGLWLRFLHFLKRSIGTIFRLVSRLFGIGLLLLQFLDYWQSSEKAQNAKSSLLSLPVPPAPHTMLTEQSVLQIDPRMCPICRKPRQNDTVLSVSGYVYCYVCISKYLQEHRRCPVTKLSASNEHLIRLYIARSG